MSDILIYGFFGEDEAHRNFLSHYLNHQYPGTFLEDDDFRYQIRARNRDQVDALLPLALAQKVKSCLDVLFVTRDVDSHHTATIKSRRETLDRACAAHQPVVPKPMFNVLNIGFGTSSAIRKNRGRIPPWNRIPAVMPKARFMATAK